MKKNNLSKTGLSLSQAQSISNLCNQRAIEIDNGLNNINNFSKKVNIDGVDHITVAAKPMPGNVVELLTNKAELTACQAFLRENMKAKEDMLSAAKYDTVDTSSLIPPKRPTFVSAELLSEVNEDFGWSKLTEAELNENYEAEAFAATIGKFIHDKSPLAKLRAELPTIPAIDWMVVKGDGTKTPVEIIVNEGHTSEKLAAIHEELAAAHRGYEQKVNFFKSKVKNLTTLENARIAKVNSDATQEALKINNDLAADYRTAEKAYNEQVKQLHADFEMERQATIKQVAALRIEIDPRFQKVIDFFIDRLPGSKD